MRIVIVAKLGKRETGCSSDWLERGVWGAQVAGSIPVIPTKEEDNTFANTWRCSLVAKAILSYGIDRRFESDHRYSRLNTGEEKWIKNKWIKNV